VAWDCECLNESARAQGANARRATDDDHAEGFGAGATGAAPSRKTCRAANKRAE